MRLTAFNIAAYSMFPGCFEIEKPKDGISFPGHYLPINGWVEAGPMGKLEHVEISCQGKGICQFTPGRESNGRQYFEGHVCALPISPVDRMVVSAQIQGGRKVALADMQVDCPPLELSYKSSLQPLMITSLGRTGTTWLMHVLNSHSEIVTSHSYPYEGRACQYWINLLALLAQPIPCDLLGTCEWPSYDPRRGPYPSEARLFPLLYSEYLGNLASATLMNIDLLYRRVSNALDKTNAKFFAEKFLPRSECWVIRKLNPNCREVFLVRDFRDVYCSIRAFNKKRGRLDFGHDKAKTEEDQLRILGAGAAALLQHWEARKDTSMLLRYEDLLLQPVDSLKRILNHLRVNCSEQQMRSMMNLSTMDSNELTFHRTSDSPISSIGRWKHELGNDLEQLSAEVLGGVLEAFGYDVRHKHSA